MNNELQTILQHHEMAAALIARVFLGLLFFFQGFDAVFRVKISGVVDTIYKPLSEKGIPSFFITAGAYYTSYVQLIGGLLLIIGFVKYYALYLLGLDLVIASVAFGLVKPVWDLQHVFPRLALLLFLLMIPAEHDVVAVDHFWSLIKFVRNL